MSNLRILFLCTGNSCRSQMAEGLVRSLGGERVEVFSAGTDPRALDPFAVRAMSEAAIDISQQVSKSFDRFVGQPFDFVITVCDRAKEECPVWPDARQRDHWSIDDPATFTGSEEERMRMFRRTRDALKHRVSLFLLANKVR